MSNFYFFPKSPMSTPTMFPWPLWPHKRLRNDFPRRGRRSRPTRPEQARSTTYTERRGQRRIQNEQNCENPELHPPSPPHTRIHLSLCVFDGFWTFSRISSLLPPPHIAVRWFESNGSRGVNGHHGAAGSRGMWAGQDGSRGHDASQAIPGLAAGRASVVAAASIL